MRACAGYCSKCDSTTWLTFGGGCPHGHAASAVGQHQWYTIAPPRAGFCGECSRPVRLDDEGLCPSRHPAEAVRCAHPVSTPRPFGGNKTDDVKRYKAWTKTLDRAEVKRLQETEFGTSVRMFTGSTVFAGSTGKIDLVGTQLYASLNIILNPSRGVLSMHPISLRTACVFAGSYERVVWAEKDPTNGQVLTGLLLGHELAADLGAGHEWRTAAGIPYVVIGYIDDAHGPQWVTVELSGSSRDAEEFARRAREGQAMLLRALGAPDPMARE
jgi:hypothetical protein